MKWYGDYDLRIGRNMEEYVVGNLRFSEQWRVISGRWR
jgi:hypothetical protein